MFSYIENLVGNNSGLPFKAPPLHVRTIASLYMGGMVMMLMAARARTLAATRIPMVVAGLFTGLLLLVSLLHLDMFEFGPPQPKPPLWGISWLPLPFQVSWFWFALYGVCPVIVAVLLRKYWAASAPISDDPLPLILRAALGLVALVGGVFALILLAMPGVGVGLWPWDITPFLAQIYAGPFLAFAVAAGMMASAREGADTGIPAAGLLAFALLALGASLYYLPVLQPFGPAAQAWLWGLTLLALLSAITLWQARIRKKGYYHD